MVARFLVTTAIEKTWPADTVPVLFLGEWCRLYDRKSAWEQRDAVVAPYHWDDREKLHQDYLYLQTVYESSLESLTQKLNEIHGTNLSNRYWRILVGPWLGFFVQMLFDRWFMLQKIIRDCGISEVRIINRQEGELIPNDMADFSHLFTEDDWNELISGQILGWMSIPIITVDVNLTDEQHCYGRSSVQSTLSTVFKRSLASFVSRIFGVLSRDDEYFFINSYLSTKDDLLLQARLGQLPKLWRSIGVLKTNYRHNARQWVLQRPETEPADVYGDFLDVLCVMVPKHLPTAYVEGYWKLVAQTDNLPWPKRPQAIFTSNAFISDDVFKAWAAAKVEAGIPLAIGQHGGNYGMALWSFTEEHQIAIADQFITWGWEDSAHKNVIPVGNLKGFSAKAVPKKRGIALLVGMNIPRYSYHMYSVPVAAGQWQNYFEDQCRFVDALPDELRACLQIRLYAHDFGNHQKQRWRRLYPDISLDDGKRPMSELIKKTRIYISTYNATTYLESLSLNFPTIIFWNPEHWELRDGIEPYFEMLKAVGIFHDSPEGAARQMAAVWDDVTTWWGSIKVQAARQAFCERFTHIPENPQEAMEKVFRHIASTHIAGGAELK